MKGALDARRTAQVANHLTKSSKVSWVRYPGLGRDPMNKMQKKKD